MRTRLFVTIACALFLTSPRIRAEETTVFAAESLDQVTMTWAEDKMGALLELNTDRQFVSEGDGSIHAAMTVPDKPQGTSYIGFRVQVAPMRLEEGRALAVDGWSSEPGATTAFYVRALDAEARIVCGWTSWSNPLKVERTTFALVPGRASGLMGWESTRIQAPDAEIVMLEFIAGSRKEGARYDMFVDNVRSIPAPEPPPVNYIEHGVMAPVGMMTWGHATIATADADGNNLVFVKIWTGGNAWYLFIDAKTGETEQIAPGAPGWGAYMTLGTPENVVYDTMGNSLVAIDVPTREVRRLGQFESGMALTFARAENGIVYAAIYPSATLVSYDPETETYTNHGPMNTESWPQYHRPLIVGKDGWVYGGVGLKAGQVVAFNPATGEKRKYIPEEQRRRGNPRLHTGTDGKVYAYAPEWGWHVMEDGEATSVEEPAERVPWIPPRKFPDGAQLTSFDIADRELFIKDAGADKPRRVEFDYKSTGVNLYTIIDHPDGKVYGATGIPLRIWSFDPATGESWHRGLGRYGGHINQFDRHEGLLFGAVYSTGALLEYDPAKPYDDRPMAESTNPRQLHRDSAARDQYGRPHAVLAHPDGRHVLVGGNAARVLLGSGLLIYDRESEEGTILTREDLIPDQGINTLVALPGGDVLVGTSVHPPTAGSREGIPETALVYRFNLKTRKITKRWPMKPNTAAVRDMVVGPDGLVYGLAEPARLFVLDADKGAFVHDEPVEGFGNASGFQAPRCMMVGPDKNIYALFRQAVVRIEPGSLKMTAISTPNAPITSGIAIVEDRLYFGSGPRLFSCALNPPEENEEAEE